MTAKKHTYDSQEAYLLNDPPIRKLRTQWVGRVEIGVVTPGSYFFLKIS